jgi:hypothetical protein
MTVAMRVKRAAQVGDVFAVRRPGGASGPGSRELAAGVGADGLLGRVVSMDAIVGPTHGCALVYVYRPGGDLSRDALLLAPMMTTRAPWSRGYFEFVRSQPLLPGDFFERHCFRDAHGSLFDEESRPLDAPSEPVGEWRLYDRVEVIEEAIAKALASAAG